MTTHSFGSNFKVNIIMIKRKNLLVMLMTLIVNYKSFFIFRCLLNHCFNLHFSTLCSQMKKKSLFKGSVLSPYDGD